ncbi:MAG: lipopolysaccharide assembly protein LapA domain-containing protein [Bacteroidota bacterium]
MNENSHAGLYKLITAVVLLILVIIFAIQNSDTTTVKLWFWDMQLPLIILFLVCFLAGLLFAVLAILPVYKSSNRKSKLIDELQSKINILEKNNTNQNP